MLARIKTLHRVAAALLEHHLQRPLGLGFGPLNYLKHGSIRDPNAEENRRANKKTVSPMSSFKGNGQHSAAVGDSYSTECTW